MDNFWDALFSHTTFARYQYRDIRWGNLYGFFDGPVQFWVVAYYSETLFCCLCVFHVYFPEEGNPVFLGLIIFIHLFLNKHIVFLYFSANWVSVCIVCCVFGYCVINGRISVGIIYLCEIVF